MPATGKSDVPLPTESSVEADGLLDLTYDPDIVDIVVQPETVEVWVDGVLRRYTPDARYTRRSGQIGYREFKHSDEELGPEYIAKLDVVAAQLKAAGYEFSIVTSDELRVGSRIDNLRLLKRYREWPTSDVFRQRVQDHLKSRLRCDLGELCDLVGYASYGSLYRMLWEQQVGVNLSKSPLSRDSEIWGLQS